MNLDQRIIALSQAIGDDIQTLLAQDGTLSGLTTTDKTSLVNAINEVAAASPVGTLLAANNLNDVSNAATARTNLDVRSTAQVTSEISSAIAAITLGSLGGLTQAEVDARVQLIVDAAPAALDTLNELAAALGNDANFSTTIANALAKRVAVDAVQTFTVGEKLQGCQNLGIGNPDTDFVSAYTTAKNT